MNRRSLLKLGAFAAVAQGVPARAEPLPDVVVSMMAAMRATHGADTFTLIDKPKARFYFIDQGQVVIDTPVLLGKQRGDDERVTPKATPAGVFRTTVFSDPKILAKYGGTVVSFLCNRDETFCYSVHETWKHSPAEKRPQRLASPQIDDNFISNGCPNIDPAIFAQLVEGLGRAHARTGRIPMMVVTPQNPADLPRFMARNFGTVIPAEAGISPGPGSRPSPG